MTVLSRTIVIQRQWPVIRRWTVLCCLALVIYQISYWEWAAYKWMRDLETQRKRRWEGENGFHCVNVGNASLLTMNHVKYPYSTGSTVDLHDIFHFKRSLSPGRLKVQLIKCHYRQIIKSLSNIYYSTNKLFSIYSGIVVSDSDLIKQNVFAASLLDTRVSLPTPFPILPLLRPLLLYFLSSQV